MYKIGYKLLIQSQSGDLISCSCPSDCKKVYQVNTWTCRSSGNGPLALYSDIVTALHHYNFFSPYNNSIYECEYMESTDENLWGWAVGRVLFTGKEKLGPGVIFADRIRLIKKINPGDYQHLLKRKKGVYY
jgi:hypothetical protein